MKRTLLGSLLLALLVAACTPGAPAQTGSAGIFREIQIGGGVIQLGKPLPGVVPPPPAGDTVVSLPAAQIGGAEAIRAHLTPSGLVRALWFDYSPRSDFDAMVAEYAATLGEPRKEPYRTGERAVWEDAQTRFELVHDPERSAGTVYSVLQDRASIN
jgi:hypothetical protein